MNILVLYTGNFARFIYIKPPLTAFRKAYNKLMQTAAIAKIKPQEISA